MPHPSETQQRLVYSLLKPAVRMAARFHVPMRTVADLARLAYFETLRRDGLSQAEIADRLGQTERHMRSLQKKLRTHFFSAETEVGLVREVENFIALHNPSKRRLLEGMSGWAPEDVQKSLDVLTSEGRVVAKGAKLHTADRYVLLTSEKFHHRIDALNHFLGGVTRAVTQRLLFDQDRSAMIKTISFTAVPAQFREFLGNLEGYLRSRIAALEERAHFEGDTEQRYVLGVAAANESESAEAREAQSGRAEKKGE